MVRLRLFSILLLYICISTTAVVADGTIEKTYNRGLGLLGNGYYDNAAKHFTDVINKGESPYLISAHLNRAQANKDAEKFDLALKDTKYLLGSGNYPAPHHLNALNAEIFMRMGNAEKSVGLFRTAMSQMQEGRSSSEGKDYTLSYPYIVALIQDSQFEKAEHQIKLFLQTRLPENAHDVFDPALQASLTVVQILKGEYELAMQSADKARITPHQLLIYPLGAVAANKLGRYDDAIDIIEEYVSQKPISARQSALFLQLKKKLWQAEKYPNVDRVSLPQENTSNLVKFLRYRIIAGHEVSITESNTSITTKFDVKMVFDLKG
ncbi:MAG: hypothetical protein V7727_13795 [Sneathiella sp.]